MNTIRVYEITDRDYPQFLKNLEYCNLNDLVRKLKKIGMKTYHTLDYMQQVNIWKG